MKNNQNIVWYATKSMNNMKKCPNHENDEKNEKISKGQLVFAVDFQRILPAQSKDIRNPGKQFRFRTDRRFFHSMEECLTSFDSRILKTYTYITAPRNHQVIVCGLNNRELQHLSDQFKNVSLWLLLPRF